MKEVPIEDLTLADFASLLNAAFRVYSDPATMVELKLVEVLPALSPGRADPSPAGVRGENFSIVFGGPGDRLLPQGIYAFEHDQIGRFVLFIVPIGKDRERFRYEAVFNRLA